MLCDVSSRTIDLATGSRRGGRARARPERAGERQRDQRERQDAQQQQRPVPDGAALHRLVRDLAQEHQRRERRRRAGGRAARGAPRSESRSPQGPRAAPAPGTTSPHPPQALARGQVVEERVVERHRRVEQRVVDPAVGEEPAERRRCAACTSARYCSRSASGTIGMRSPLSRSSKLAASSNGKSISAGSSTWNTMTSWPRKRSGLTACAIALRLVVEVRDDDDDAAAGEALGQREQRSGQRARLRPSPTRSSA